MPKKTPSLNILKEFAALEKKAAKQVFSAKAAIEKKIASEVAAIHKKYAKELKQIESMVTRFGAAAPKTKVKAVGAGKRTRRTLPKVTDDQIKAALSSIAAGGKKVTSAEIFKAAGIERPRFAMFLKGNSGFLNIEGNKRSTKYSLKGNQTNTL